MYKSLTLEACFHIRLLKVKSVSVLTENQILRGGPIMCDITNSLEANLGLIFNFNRFDVET